MRYESPGSKSGSIDEPIGVLSPVGSINVFVARSQGFGNGDETAAEQANREESARISDLRSATGAGGLTAAKDVVNQVHHIRNSNVA